MRRVQAIFAIAVLLALPLALLIDAGAGAMGMCDGYCCVPHARHSAQVQQPAQQVGKEKPGEGMACHHGELAHQLNCTMKSNSRAVDYGILSPLAPTHLSSSAELTSPVISRRTLQTAFVILEAGFRVNPFQPPRA